jgi:hypothetical protein
MKEMATVSVDTTEQRPISANTEKSITLETLSSISEEPESRLRRKTSLPELGFNPDRRPSISNAKPISWILGKSGRISQKLQLASTEEVSETSGSASLVSGDGPDNSEPKLRKSFSDMISQTKAKIQQIVDPNRRVRLTRREQHRMIEKSIDEMWSDKYALDLPPEISQDKSEMEYLCRTQMEAALKNLVIQDANLETGETTTEVLSETVRTPGPQGLSESISTNEGMASGLAMFVTAIAVTSPSLPTDTAEITTQVDIGENLVTRTGSLRVRTTRTTLRTPIVEGDTSQESENDYFSLPKIQEYVKSPQPSTQKETDGESRDEVNQNSQREVSEKGNRQPRGILSRMASLKRRDRPPPQEVDNKRPRVEATPPTENEEAAAKDQDKEKEQPEISLPTPPDSTRNSESNVEADLPISPKPEERGQTSTKLLTKSTLALTLRTAKPTTLIAHNIAVEAARMEIGMPTQSPAMANFIKFNQMRMNMPVPERPMMNDETSEETRRMMRKVVRNMRETDRMIDMFESFDSYRGED